MVWFALILALGVGIGIGIFTSDIKRALRVGLITLALAVMLSLELIFSGIMGG